MGKYLRLHTATWLAVGILLFVLTYLNNSSQVEQAADYLFAGGNGINSRFLVFGWPRWFWFYGPFEWTPFLADVAIWLFLLIGVATIVETHIRRYGSPKVSLLFVLGAVAVVAFYFNEGSLTDFGSPFPFEPFSRINHFFFLLITLAFGFAVCGWLQVLHLIWRTFIRRLK